MRNDILTSSQDGDCRDERVSDGESEASFSQLYNLYPETTFADSFVLKISLDASRKLGQLESHKDYRKLFWPR